MEQESGGGELSEIEQRLGPKKCGDNDCAGRTLIKNGGRVQGRDDPIVWYSSSSISANIFYWSGISFVFFAAAFPIWTCFRVSTWWRPKNWFLPPSATIFDVFCRSPFANLAVVAWIYILWFLNAHVGRFCVLFAELWYLNPNVYICLLFTPC